MPQNFVRDAATVYMQRATAQTAASISRAPRAARRANPMRPSDSSMRPTSVAPVSRLDIPAKLALRCLVQRTTTPAPLAEPSAPTTIVPWARVPRAGAHCHRCCTVTRRSRRRKNIRHVNSSAESRARIMEQWHGAPARSLRGKSSAIRCALRLSRRSISSPTPIRSASCGSAIARRRPSSARGPTVPTSTRFVYRLGTARLYYDD
ncbi:unnamed protein product [Trichogramma brassicae]|uniref:Uncharacterized protein n=1 Tax=Trichogramma brassicae TaxID=86971 RepID=A0A6H5I4N1_9HYME|nr:unnamed protein product [Trichogramma brassicae]